MTSRVRVQDLGLTIEDLRGVAYVCLGAAATTNLDSFPPGSGDMRRWWWHRRRERFEIAAAALEGGEEPSEDQQLTLEDVRWALTVCLEGYDIRDRFARAVELLTEAEG